MPFSDVPAVEPSFESQDTPAEYTRYEASDCEASNSAYDAQKDEYLRLGMLSVCMYSIRLWPYRSPKRPCHFSGNEEHC